MTGSCHQLLMDAEHSLLIDCGLFQGAKTSGEGKSAADRLAIEFPLDTIKALVATHVHIDHVGRIPYLLAAGFKGPILCIESSAKLLSLVLEDAFRLGFSRDQKQVERYIKLAEQRIIDLHYPKTGEKSSIVFSGDLGTPHAPLLPAPKSPCRADILVIESTYGDRFHEDRRTRRRRLERVVEQAMANNGTVLIPAFSIGRMQELLYELEDIIHSKRLDAGGKGQAKAAAPNPSPEDGKHSSAVEIDWPALPIILDSPLASRFTQVYRELKPFWGSEALERVKQGCQPLAFEQLITVDSHGTSGDSTSFGTNRSSGYCHCRERYVQRCSHSQLSKSYAPRPTSRRALYLLSGTRHTRLGHPDVW